MRDLIKVLFAIILTSLTFAAQAHDEEKIFSWDEVTEFEDGSPIADLTHYNLYLNNDAPIKVNSPIISYIKLLPHGTYTGCVTAVVTFDEKDYESELSECVIFTILGEKDYTPKPPPILRVN